MMRQIISTADRWLFIVFMAVFLGGCQKNDEMTGEGGWARSITDRTVVVSVFANEEKQDEKLQKLSEAISYIGKEMKSYAASADFVYDWSQDDSLKLYYDFEKELTGDARNTEAVSSYLVSEGNREALLQKYSAQSIVYIFYVDAGEDNQIPSECYMWTQEGDPEDEFIIMYDYVNQKPEGAMVIAHEILHAFGAKDLYVSEKENSDQGVPENYVNYLREQKCNDIMFSVYGDEPKLGMTTAYFLGLTSECPDKKYLQNN